MITVDQAILKEVKERGETTDAEVAIKYCFGAYYVFSTGREMATKGLIGSEWTSTAERTANSTLGMIRYRKIC